MFRKGFRVIDIHAHLPWEANHTIKNEIFDAYNKERSERMRLTWDFPAPESETDEEKKKNIMERWFQELEKYQIGALNFLTSASNEDLADKIASYPDRFTGFAHHPIEDDDALEKLVFAVDNLGLKGYKMFGPLVEKPLDDPSFKKIWRFMADRKLPLLIHFGLLGKGGGLANHININPLAIFKVAREFPEIPIIIPHFGAGYFRELLHLCWSSPSIYVDTSGSNQWMRWMPYHLDLEILFRKTFELIGSERIIYGSDSNGFPRGYAYRYLQDQLRVCRDINMREDDIENIFGNNASKLLNI